MKHFCSVISSGLRETLQKKGSGKGMKCPEGWRGEEKQEQAPCVEIQAGEREERESGVQAGMAKMQRGSAVQGTGRETPTKKRPSRENKKIQEVSLRQALLMGKWECHSKIFYHHLLGFRGKSEAHSVCMICIEISFWYYFPAYVILVG